MSRYTIKCSHGVKFLDIISVGEGRDHIPHHSLSMVISSTPLFAHIGDILFIAFTLSSAVFKSIPPKSFFELKCPDW